MGLKMFVRFWLPSVSYFVFCLLHKMAIWYCSGLHRQSHWLRLLVWEVLHNMNGTEKYINYSVSYWELKTFIWFWLPSVSDLIYHARWQHMAWFNLSNCPHIQPINLQYVRCRRLAMGLAFFDSIRRRLGQELVVILSFCSGMMLFFGFES